MQSVLNPSGGAEKGRKIAVFWPTRHCRGGRVGDGRGRACVGGRSRKRKGDKGSKMSKKKGEETMVAVLNPSLFYSSSLSSLTTLILCHLCVTSTGSADARPIGVSALAVSAICGALGARKRDSQRVAGPALGPNVRRKNGTIKIAPVFATYAGRTFKLCRENSRRS